MGRRSDWQIVSYGKSSPLFGHYLANQSPLSQALHDQTNFSSWSFLWMDGWGKRREGGRVSYRIALLAVALLLYGVSNKQGTWRNCGRGRGREDLTWKTCKTFGGVGAVCACCVLGLHW